MVNSKRRYRYRDWLVAGAFILLASAAACLLARSGLGRSLDLKTYDLAMILRAPRAAPGVVIITVDDKSRARLTEPLLFWHDYYAKVFGALAKAGSRAAGVDMIFGLPVEQWTPGADRRLAQAYLEAVQRGTPMVLGCDRRSPPPDLPIYLFATSNGLMAFLNLVPDEDDFIRRQQLAWPGAGSEEIYSFALQLAAQALRQPIQRRGQALFLGDRYISSGPEADILIDYGAPGALQIVSFVDVLDAIQAGENDFLNRTFHDRIVIIGSDDALDRHSTPYYLAASKARRSLGVEIHGWAVASLLSGRLIRPASQRTILLLLVALVAASTALSMRLRWWAALLGMLALTLGFAAASFWLLRQMVWVAPWTCLLGPPISYAAVFVYRYRVEFRGRRRLRRLFGQYVSPKVVEEILERDVPLGGKRQEITVLISDIRDFTAWSERVRPEELVGQLDEYFAKMTQAIVEQDGFVDKFMGDGILALFGAPIERDDHAWRAVQAAAAMLRYLEELNETWAAEGRETLAIGIGIHSGEAVVGTIGSSLKLEYTALGDAVNVASRVESKTRECGAPLLISAATLEKLNQHPVEVDPVGWHEVKGKTVPAELFSVRRVGEQVSRQLAVVSRQ